MFSFNKKKLQTSDDVEIIAQKKVLNCVALIFEFAMSDFFQNVSCSKKSFNCR